MHEKYNTVGIDYCGGIKTWRLFIVSYIAKMLGMLVHVNGFPLGTDRNIHRNAHE